MLDSSPLMRSSFLGYVVAVFMGLLPGAVRAATCASLASLKLPDTTIVVAELVTAGTFTPPYGNAVANLPGFCRVGGVLHPTPDSHILFEVWMPEKGWNQKFLGVGNGGFAGEIGYGGLGSNLRRGYATAGTDTGHEAQSEDASWAYKHPEKIVDFGHRALHLTTVDAKAVVAAFYGNGPHKSYFDSCSDGGREALMEAQRYPEDYDGILAGAPANYWTHMLASGIDVQKGVFGDPAGYISAMKLPAITKAVLEACDANDGLKDGILNDPRACHFNPETMLCKNGDSLTCLTAPQVGALKKLYKGGSDKSGKSIFPGFMPGDEAGTWGSWVLGSGPGGSSGASYLQGFFRYMVFNDPSWNSLTADVDVSLRAADARAAVALNSTDPDLGRFAARGGKLILYHGWQDPAISPLNTIAYFESVSSKMGAEKTANFARLYMVPGMGHCLGGVGPSAFGQFGIVTAKGDPFGAFASLEDWVEKGRAPAEIVATKYKGPGGDASKVEMTRPLCPYPQVAKYAGSGDVKDADNFRCVAAER